MIETRADFRALRKSAFRPDAFRHSAGKRIAAEAGSYNVAETRLPPPKPAPRIVLFVGEAFRPEAFRHGSGKSIAAEAASYNEAETRLRPS